MKLHILGKFMDAQEQGTFSSKFLRDRYHDAPPMLFFPSLTIRSIRVVYAHDLWLDKPGRRE